LHIICRNARLCL